MTLLTASESVADLLSQAEKIKLQDKAETERLARKALQISKEHNDVPSEIHAWILIAYCQHHSSNSEQFFKTIFHVLDLLEHSYDVSRLSYCKYLIACGYRNLGDYDSTAENFLQGLALAEEAGDADNIIRCLNGLGNMHHFLGDNSGSLDYLNRAIAHAEELGVPALTAQVLGNQADVFVSLGKFQEARENLEKVLLIFNDLQDLGGAGQTRVRLAKLLVAEGKVEKGLEKMQEIYDDAKRFDIRIGISFVANEMVDILFLLNRHEEAKALIDESLKIAVEINLLSILPDLYEKLYKYYKLINDHKSALMYHELFHESNEKVNSQQASARLKNQDTLNEIRLVRKQSEIDHLKHIELRKAYEEIEVRNREITDSIVYSRRIQHALLPGKDVLSEFLQDSFLIYAPRNIVSGDFYWLSPPVHGNKDLRLIAVADCTGHGVPGALMSMIGTMLLSQVVNTADAISPAAILEQLDKELSLALNQHSAGSRDGMDVVLCLHDAKKRTAVFASALRPVLVIRNNGSSLEELIPTKRSIGGINDSVAQFPFTDIHLTLDKGDRVYMFSDGFADQFGGAKGKKMMMKNFKSLLQKTSSLAMMDQGSELERAFHDWKGDLEQTDDVTVLGFAVK